MIYIVWTWPLRLRFVYKKSSYRTTGWGRGSPTDAPVLNLKRQTRILDCPECLTCFIIRLQVENERSASLHTDPESLPPPTEGGVTIDSTAELLGVESEVGSAEDRTASGCSPRSTEGDVEIDSTAEQLDVESEGGTAEDRTASGYSPPPPPPGGDELREEPLTVELLKQKESEEGDTGTFTVADE